MPGTDTKKRPDATDPRIQAEAQKRLRDMPLSEFLAKRRRPQKDGALNQATAST